MYLYFVVFLRNDFVLPHYSSASHLSFLQLNLELKVILKSLMPNVSFDRCHTVAQSLYSEWTLTMCPIVLCVVAYFSNMNNAVTILYTV